MADLEYHEHENEFKISDFDDNQSLNDRNVMKSELHTEIKSENIEIIKEESCKTEVSPDFNEICEKDNNIVNTESDTVSITNDKAENKEVIDRTSKLNETYSDIILNNADEKETFNEKITETPKFSQNFEVNRNMPINEINNDKTESQYKEEKESKASVEETVINAVEHDAEKDVNHNDIKEFGDIGSIKSQCLQTSSINIKEPGDIDTKTLEAADETKSDTKPSDTENFIDILGNGLLTKKIIVNGLGRETRPNHGDSVTIQYRGWNSSGVLFEEKEVSFVLGDGDMIQAFDLGICLAERHEEFELKTDARFAYGSHGWEPHVEPNESLTYRIKLLRVDDAPDYATFSYKDRMEVADIKRERGNYLFRREEYSLAVNSYSRAIKIIQTDPDYKRASTDPSKSVMYDLFIKVTNNLAAAQLKLESYDNVIETCNTILNYDATNVKALFRKGKSLTNKGNYDEAIPILKKALEFENSKLIAMELQRCCQLKRAEDEQRARVCRKMFGTETKGMSEKSSEKTVSNWKKAVYKYSPYIGAVLITGISVMLASIAIAKSKEN